MQIQDYATHYAERTDEELLRLLLESDQLTDDANLALSGELNRRGLDKPERIASFRIEEEKRKREIANHPGHFFFIHYYGIGRKRFGKADRKVDPESGVEEFTTTVFAVFFWIPLIPLGSYRMRRHTKSLASGAPAFERLPLDWVQIMQVWAATGVVAVLIMLVLRLMMRR
jgi:hypothetical protein